ncbi:plasmid replication protein, CyRepA1 family [Methylobacter sp. YRD-M1]|uniref:plasmid replication protein, CyRepA1 family n=1 Tax=Methylobacter sp. YRD-M1 TaxID=2911520 RepID=UPI00227A6532|nr:plasmid replication protein, CyRepA1 family [Methylobacter sp. YRD-M1]WAK01853.1 hypothetical protein LZ558_18870 [Methylobacter sp. YRD-M1]
MNTTGQKSFITVLKGKIPCNKVFNFVNGEVVKPKPTHAKHFDYTTVYLENIVDLYNAIKETAKDPNKLIIRGKGPKEKGTRAQALKSFFSDEGSQWICFDFDDQITPIEDSESVEAIEYLIRNTLPAEFHNVSYVLQWSSSAGLHSPDGQSVKAGTSAHVFFYLDKILNEAQMKSWFSEQINAKKVDGKVFQTVQKIFINPFAEYKCDGFFCTIPDNEKISLIKKAEHFVTAPEITIAVEETKKPRTYSQRQGTKFDEDFLNDILNFLNEHQIICARNKTTVNLRSPKEKSEGGYFLFKNNPTLVLHHNSDKTRTHIEDWLMEHYGIEYKVKVKPLNAIISEVKNKQTGHKNQPFTFDDFNESSIELHEQYLPRDIIPLNKNEIVYMKSAKGTGKTEAMIDLVNRCRAAGKSVCLIGHREKLLEAQAERVGLLCYNDIDTDITNAPYLAICINSLLRLENSLIFGGKGKNYDVVIIDESEQVFAHFTQQTIDAKPRKQIGKLFHRMFTQSQTIVVADADLSYLSVSIMEEVAKKHDAFYIENTYQPGIGKSIEVYENLDTIKVDFLEDAKAGKSIYYCSNAKAQVDEMAQILKNNKITHFSITKDNSKSKEAVRVLKLLSQKQDTDYQVILVSPSVSTGVDIQTPFDIVYGVFKAGITTYTDCDQQLFRCRHTLQTRVFIEHKNFNNIDTDPDVIRKDIAGSKAITRKNLIGSWIQMDNIKREEGEDWWQWLVTIKVMVEANNNMSKQAFKRLFKTLKKNQGYKIIDVKTVCDEEDIIEAVDKEDIGEKVKKIQQAKKITPMQYEELKKRQTSDEDQYVLLRHQIERSFCSDVEEDETIAYLWFNNFLQDLHKYENHIAGINKWEMDDISETLKHHDIDKQHHLAKQALITACLKKLSAVDSELEFAGGWSFTKGDTKVTTFQSYCQAMSRVEKNILGITLDGHRITHNPVMVIKSFLSLVGLKAEAYDSFYSKDGNNNKQFIYRLDPIHFGHLKKYSELRRSKTFNKSTDFVMQLMQAS